MKNISHYFSDLRVLQTRDFLIHDKFSKLTVCKSEESIRLKFIESKYEIDFLVINK